MTMGRETVTACDFNVHANRRYVRCSSRQL
jgi:hypothetical protein